MRENRKKPKYKKIFIIFLLMGLIFFEGPGAVKHLLLSAKDKAYGLIPPIRLPIEETDNKYIISSGSLYSPYAVLIRLDDHKILMEKNSERKIYPASLTKIMTGIVAIENLPDLQQRILLPNDIFNNLYAMDASMAGFFPREKVSALDLLYGALLPSGAECCLGLADAVAGSEQNFVQLMNRKAKEIGMKNTNFANTTGLHDDDHYTTVKDLSILLEYALENDTFREIFTSSKYSTASTNRHPDGITFYNTMFKNMKGQSIDGGEILGGKTGYTEQAGLCLASLAIKDGTQYILITAGANGNHQSKQYNIQDAIAVYGRLGRK